MENSYPKRSAQFIDLIISVQLLFPLRLTLRSPQCSSADVVFSSTVTFTGANGDVTAYTISDSGTSMENPTLVFRIGQNYTFDLTAVSAIHPLYLTTEPDSCSAAECDGEWADFDNGASGRTVPFSAAASLAGVEMWYMCGFHSSMRGRVVVTENSERCVVCVKIRSLSRCWLTQSEGE